MNVVIEGERYRGVFEGNYGSGKFDVGSEYYSSTEARYWYKGWGFIEDRERIGTLTSARYYFGFETPQIREPYEWNQRYDLEGSLINYYQKGRDHWDKEPKIIEGVYPKIVDLALGKMVDEVRVQRSDLPYILVARVSVDELIARGLSYDKEGQLHLPQLV